MTLAGPGTRRVSIASDTGPDGRVSHRSSDGRASRRSPDGRVSRVRSSAVCRASRVGHLVSPCAAPSSPPRQGGPPSECARTLDRRRRKWSRLGRRPPANRPSPSSVCSSRCSPWLRVSRIEIIVYINIDRLNNTYDTHTRGFRFCVGRAHDGGGGRATVRKIIKNNVFSPRV